MKTKKTIVRKKQIQPSSLPELKMLPAGKKDDRGADIYYLYINGETHKDKFAYDGENFVCYEIETNYVKSLFRIPCKCFPDSIRISIDFNTSLINGILYDERNLRLLKEKNIFTMYLHYDSERELNYMMVNIDYYKLIEKMKNLISQSKGTGLTIEKNNDNLVVIAKGKPDETVQQVYDRLIKRLQSQMNTLKISLLKEIKKTEKDIMNHSLKWDSTF